MDRGASVAPQAIKKAYMVLTWLLLGLAVLAWIFIPQARDAWVQFLWSY